MASDKIKNLSFAFTYRSAPAYGPSSSDAWNDSFTELANDLSNISLEWNNKIVKVFESLPAGTEDTGVDALKTGIEGKTIWADKDVVATDYDLTFFNSTRSRPNTIKEQFDHVYGEITSRISNLTNNIIDQATGLTVDQKNRIGANVFDSGAVSSSTSLDGKSELNRLNIVQIYNDLYGSSGVSLDNNGAGQLVNTVFQMVDALLELHNGNWDNDISLSHTGTFSAAQSEVGASHPGDDTYTGSPTNLIQDLNRIRNTIKTIKGTAGWLTSLPQLYSGGTSNLYGLLFSTKGSATKSASNPWGYAYNDIDGLNTRLNAVATFTGQSSQIDTSPDYSSTAYISDGDSLEEAIGKLDAAIVTISSELTGVSHNTLSNLGADDHTQYVLADGTREMDHLDVENDIAASGTIKVAFEVEIVAGGSGVIMASPDGTRYRLSIANGGGIITTAI